MSTQYWFKKRKGVTDFGRPANWKGWVALLITVFFVAIIAQLVGQWASTGFNPPAKGVWLLAFGFIILGGFIKLCNMKSPPPNTDQT